MQTFIPQIFAGCAVNANTISRSEKNAIVLTYKGGRRT